VATDFHRWSKLVELNFFMRKTFREMVKPGRHAKSSSQLVNWCLILIEIPEKINMSQTNELYFSEPYFVSTKEFMSTNFHSASITTV